MENVFTEMVHEKRKYLSLETKIEIIKLVDECQMKKYQIAKKFWIPVNSLSTIFKKISDLLLG